MASSFYKMLESRESELSLNKVSRWIINIAMPVLIVLLAGLVALCLLLKYPKYEEIVIKFIPEQVPVIVFNDESRKLHHLFFHSNDSIKQGESIATFFSNDFSGLDSLKSPDEGRLLINYDFKSSYTMLLIAPINAKFAVRGLINAGKIGFIEKGMGIDIFLEGYPKDFGAVKGEIVNISSFPVEGFYSLNIRLVNGIKTAHGKEILPSNVLNGHAKILTENENLLAKLLNSMKSTTSVVVK
jgi:hypothetical protein